MRHVGERALLELSFGKLGLCLSKEDRLGPWPLFLLKGMRRDSASRKAKRVTCCGPSCCAHLVAQEWCPILQTRIILGKAEKTSRTGIFELCSATMSPPHHLGTGPTLW